MSDPHSRLKVLAHDAIPPFPKVFWGVFGVTLLYVIVVFVVTGQAYIVGGAH